MPKDQPLTIEMIDKVFADAQSQSGYLIGLYRLAYPDTFDDIDHCESYPRVSSRTSHYLFDKAIAWDQSHKLESGYPLVDVLPGGAWMNRGFSTTYDEEGYIEDWKVRPCPYIERVTGRLVKDF
jgi:hypothetical protein